MCYLYCHNVKIWFSVQALKSGYWKTSFVEYGQRYCMPIKHFYVDNFFLYTSNLSGHITSEMNVDFKFTSTHVQAWNTFCWSHYLPGSPPLPIACEPHKFFFWGKLISVYPVLTAIAVLATPTPESEAKSIVSELTADNPPQCITGNKTPATTPTEGRRIVIKPPLHSHTTFTHTYMEW